MIPAAHRETDARIVARSLTDPGAFAPLFDRHADDVFRYLARRHGAGVADDLLAETFAVAFERRHRYDSARQDARPWLFGIATNIGRRHRRAEARRWRALSHAGTGPEAEPMIDVVTARVSAQAMRPLLAQALRRMPARHRDVLLLIAWAELDYAETADALGIPIGTVRSRMHRARATLRASLDQTGDQGDERNG